MLEDVCAGDGFKKTKTSSISFTRSDQNLSDSLEKETIQAKLQSALSSGKLIIEVGQWIAHDEPKTYIRSFW